MSALLPRVKEAEKPDIPTVKKGGSGKVNSYNTGGKESRQYGRVFAAGERREQRTMAVGEKERPRSGGDFVGQEEQKAEKREGSPCGEKGVAE